jgi:hypothetical protein
MVAIDNPHLIWIRESVLGFVFTVKHIPGKNNAAADALSRYPLQMPADALQDQCVQNIIQALEDNKELIKPGIADLVAATTRDVELQALKRCIRGDVPHAGLADLLARFCPWIRPNQRAQDRIAASGLPPDCGAPGIAKTSSRQFIKRILVCRGASA